MILSGKNIAAKWAESLKKRAAGKNIALKVILVGDDEASLIYDRAKVKMANELGIGGELLHLPESTTERDLLQVLRELNDDPSTHGILVQLPLPKHINEAKILESISPSKDVDGFHPYNKGLLYEGSEFMPAATALGIIKLLEESNIKISGKTAVVVGASNIVGKPVAAMLLNRGATVITAHSKTKNLSEITKLADILVVAVGKSNLITDKHIKKGAVLVDVGTNRINGKVVGDISPTAYEIAKSYTPVPGGVGPMTIAALMSNTITAYEGQNGKVSL